MTIYRNGKEQAIYRNGVPQDAYVNGTLVHKAKKQWAITGSNISSIKFFDNLKDVKLRFDSPDRLLTLSNAASIFYLIAFKDKYIGYTGLNNTLVIIDRNGTILSNTAPTTIENDWSEPKALNYVFTRLDGQVLYCNANSTTTQNSRLYRSEDGINWTRVLSISERINTLANSFLLGGSVFYRASSRGVLFDHSSESLVEGIIPSAFLGNPFFLSPSGRYSFQTIPGAGAWDIKKDIGIAGSSIVTGLTRVCYCREPAEDALEIDCISNPLNAVLRYSLENGSWVKISQTPIESTIRASVISAVSNNRMIGADGAASLQVSRGTTEPWFNFFADGTWTADNPNTSADIYHSYVNAIE